MQNIFVRAKVVDGKIVADYSPYFNGCIRCVQVKQIPVRIEENEEDWKFHWHKRAMDNKFGLAVF
ncbi:hypothetical protein KC963_01395 [Candidatus Saccharibacteria bacterium]|nr:hypothetical protein [Candidatus Saccharibacteria bacterium]